ncbi:MAG: hypothetical protein FGF48_06375 [Candidatus Brockarchaeota archaeon]|nr:hypothetical protein [Candidatus Brockarchaeota archaeon]
MNNGTHDPFNVGRKGIVEEGDSLMEELLETLEVMQDEELVNDLKESLKGVEEGRLGRLTSFFRS